MPAERERGSAVVDFVLVSVLILTLLMAVLQVAVYAHLRNVLVASAQEGARYAADDQKGQKFGAMPTLDLRFSWPWRQAELYIGSQNFLNRRYEEFQGYPLPGRTFYGGVELRLWG